MDNLDRCLVQLMVQKAARKLMFLCCTEPGCVGGGGGRFFIFKVRNSYEKWDYKKVVGLLI
jgi:hypothetical protein